MLKKQNPTETQAWKKLETHFESMASVEIKDLFKQDKILVLLTLNRNKSVNDNNNNILFLNYQVEASISVEVKL